MRISKRDIDVAKRPNANFENHSFDLSDIESHMAGKEPDGKPIPAEKVQMPPLIWRGMQFKELSAEEGKKRGGRIEIVHIKTGSPADHAGLYEGAIISELKHAGDPEIKKLDALDTLKMLAATAAGPVAVYTALDGYVTVEEK